MGPDILACEAKDAGASEDDVTDPDRSCLSFSIPDEGVFTAAHGEEEGATDKPGSCLLSREDGHLESVVEDYWRRAFSCLVAGSSLV